MSLALSGALFLCEKVADQASFIFVFDACEHFRAECLDCFRTIKRHLGVDLAAAEMARLASGFKDGFDLRREVDLRGGAGWGRFFCSQDVRDCGGSRASIQSAAPVTGEGESQCEHQNIPAHVWHATPN